MKQEFSRPVPRDDWTSLVLSLIRQFVLFKSVITNLLNVTKFSHVLVTECRFRSQCTK